MFYPILPIIVQMFLLGCPQLLFIDICCLVPADLQDSLANFFALPSAASQFGLSVCPIENDNKEFINNKAHKAFSRVFSMLYVEGETWF